MLTGLTVIALSRWQTLGWLRTYTNQGTSDRTSLGAMSSCLSSGWLWRACRRECFHRRVMWYVSYKAPYMVDRNLWKKTFERLHTCNFLLPGLGEQTSVLPCIPSPWPLASTSWGEASALLQSEVGMNVTNCSCITHIIGKSRITSPQIC